MKSRRSASAAEHVSHERWLVSYADFMTLLFAFFVVLFASSHREGQSIKKVSTAIRGGFQEMGAIPDSSLIQISGRKAAVPSASTLPVTSTIDFLALRNQIQSALGKEIERHEVVMRVTPDGFVISLRELGFFDSGEARLLPGAAEKIQRIAGILMQHGLDMRVEGHSDNVPIHTAAFRSNWELSTARAMAVVMLLVDNSGFDPERISVAGYGQYRPVAANDSSDGRRINRRVDLVIIGTTPSSAVPDGPSPQIPTRLQPPPVPRTF